MFQLVTIAGGAPVPVLAADGKPFVFPTGAEAAQVDKEMSAARGVKVQPRPLADDGSWKWREALRFADGTYQHVPFHGAPWFVGSEPWREHFLHISTDRPDMVAFTESPEKGVADRQTRLRVGAYLTRFFSDVLSADEIRDIATAFTAEREANTVLFASTEDEIERVYLAGPRSCMSHPVDDYASPFHPVRVYAAGDLQLAYLERDEEVTARVLVWPERKLYSNPYGDAVRLLGLLRAAGYVAGDLDGARMKRVLHKGRFVVPYVDSSLFARDAGDFLIIDADGDVDCEVTSGLSDERMDASCERCDERVRSDDLVTVHTSGWHGRTMVEGWCSCCADANTFTCDATGDQWSDEDCVRMANGDYWSRAHFDDHGFICPDCGENFPISEGVTGDDGEIRCAECHERWQEENAESEETVEAA